MDRNVIIKLAFYLIVLAMLVFLLIKEKDPCQMCKLKTEVYGKLETLTCREIIYNFSRLCLGAGRSSAELIKPPINLYNFSLEA